MQERDDGDPTKSMHGSKPTNEQGSAAYSLDGDRVVGGILCSEEDGLKLLLVAMEEEFDAITEEIRVARSSLVTMIRH